MKTKESYQQIHIDGFYQALKEPSTLLLTYDEGLTLKVKADIPNGEFIVYEPYTEINVERVYDDFGRGGLMFFRCPSCNERKKYLIRSHREVKCGNCFTLEEILNNLEE